MNHLFNDTDRCGVENLIKDKFVFFGVYQDNTNDIIFPPTHIALPGIYIHAMALENFDYYGKMIVNDHRLFNMKYLSLNIIWHLFVCLTLFLVNESFSFFNQKAKYIIEDKYKKGWAQNSFLTIVYIILLLLYFFTVCCWILLIAMIVPFQFFAMAPLSGFDFAVALGIINLPSIITRLNKWLEFFGINQNFCPEIKSNKD